MTNPTLERAARAVDAWAFDPDNGGMLKEARQQMAFDTARAVLMAVREPDELMIDAGKKDSPYVDQEDVGDIFTAMIDAIIEENDDNS